MNGAAVYSPSALLTELPSQVAHSQSVKLLGLVVHVVPTLTHTTLYNF